MLSVSTHLLICTLPMPRRRCRGGGGLPSSSVVGFFGVRGHFHCSFGVLGGIISLPSPPPLPPCGVARVETWASCRGGLQLGPPQSSPPLSLSSSLGPPGGEDGRCEGYDAGLAISKTISALYHSTQTPRAASKVLPPDSMGKSSISSSSSN